MIRRILFVCSGNTCRSSMAETLLRDKLAHCSSGWSGDVVVESAGVSATPGDPASRFACEAMKARGLDLSGHRARKLTEEDIVGADLIVTMTRAHKRVVLAMVPSAYPKVFTLRELSGIVSADPARQQEYRELREKVGQRLSQSEAAQKRAELDATRKELLEHLTLLDAERIRQGQKVAGEISEELDLLEKKAGPSPDISDPFGRDLDTYSACAAEIASHLDALLDYVAKDAGDSPGGK